MQTQVEIHGKVETPIEQVLMPDDFEEKLALDEYREACKLSSELGMSGLAKMDADTILAHHRPAIVERLDLKPMSAHEMKVWSRWLPSIYSDDQEAFQQFFGRRIKSLSDYKYDFVPLSVRRIISQFKQTPVFDCLFVATPEKVKRPDPALFGQLGDKVYLLARWGESDEALISFEEIEKQLKKEGLL
jgi:hypothetical protein